MLCSMYQPANIAVSVLFQQVFQTFYGVLDVLGILFHLLNILLHLLNSLLAGLNLLFDVLFHVLNSLHTFLNLVSHSLLASLVLSLQLIVLVESSLELLGSLEVLSLGGYGLSAYLLGLCCGNHIALAQELETDADRRSILAEEYGHAIRNVGNILDQTNPDNRKEERKARLFSYDRLFGIEGIAKALMYGCRNRYEMAKFLDVSEKVLEDALTCYSAKYGQRIETDEYDLYFEPCLMVVSKGE